MANQPFADYGRWHRLAKILQVRPNQGHPRAGAALQRNDIHWMFLGAQEKPQASTTVPVFNVKINVIHRATGHARAQRESVDLDRPTKM